MKKSLEKDYKNDCIIVNILGGPGVGKSILTSDIFAELKRRFISAEISPEYIKKKLREGALKAVESQIYIFGKQQYQIFSMKDEVDVIVTDSPFIFCSIYDKTKNKELESLIMTEFNKYDNLNYLILRDKDVPYEQEGRYQDYDGASEVDREMKNFLLKHKIEHKTVYGIGEDVKKNIINEIVEKLYNKNKVNKIEELSYVDGDNKIEGQFYEDEDEYEDEEEFYGDSEDDNDYDYDNDYEN